MNLKFFFLIFLSLKTFSQTYETVVEDVVFNSSSKVVIDTKTLQESKAPDLVSLITTQANITLFNNNFQPPQLFLRGGDSSHILFILDGVPLYDVAWAQRTLNLNNLDIKNIRRIEILKGGQTVLHGGQALAGVIKIETFGAEFQDENQASLSGSLPVDPFDRGLGDDRRFGLSHEKKISPESGFKISGRTLQRKNQSPILHSQKLYDQFNDNLDMGYQSRGPIHFQARQFWYKTKSYSVKTVQNMMGQQSLEDSDVRNLDEQLGLSLSAKFQDLILKPKIALFGQQGTRSFYSKPDSADVDIRYKSALQGALFDLQILEQSKVSVLAGLSYLKEDFELNNVSSQDTADVFSETRGIYGMVKVSPASNFLFEAGARKEEVSHLEAKDSYQIGVTLFQRTKLEWATGYRAPSAAQKYGLFENRNLEPELSQTYSLTQDFPLSESGEISFTLFETAFRNYIEARSIGGGQVQYQNTARVKTRGIETSATYTLDESQTLQASYAYQEPWDQARHERLRRRPLVSGSLRYLYQKENWGGMIETTGSGNRYDFYINNRYVFPGYMLLNSSLRYKMNVSNQVSLRINNWLDTRPEVSIDYYAEGRSALLTWEHLF